MAGRRRSRRPRRGSRARPPRSELPRPTGNPLPCGVDGAPSAGGTGRSVADAAVPSGVVDHLPARGGGWNPRAIFLHAAPRHGVAALHGAAGHGRRHALSVADRGESAADHPPVVDRGGDRVGPGHQPDAWLGDLRRHPGTGVALADQHPDPADPGRRRARSGAAAGRARRLDVHLPARPRVRSARTSHGAVAHAVSGGCRDGRQNPDAGLAARHARRVGRTDGVPEAGTTRSRSRWSKSSWWRGRRDRCAAGSVSR